MERPHYRRVTGSGASEGATQGNQPKRSTFSERLVTQFIICGVIMALILVLNLISSSLAHNIKSAIQDQPTADEVKQVFMEASNTVRTFFGKPDGGNAADNYNLASDTQLNAAANTDSPAPSAGPSVSPAPAVDSTQAQGTSAATTTDFRIDEDILTQIQADSAGQ